MLLLDERLEVHTRSELDGLGEQARAHDDAVQVLLIPVEVRVQIDLQIRVFAVHCEIDAVAVAGEELERVLRGGDNAGALEHAVIQAAGGLDGLVERAFLARVKRIVCAELLGQFTLLFDKVEDRDAGRARQTGQLHEHQADAARAHDGDGFAVGDVRLLGGGQRDGQRLDERGGLQIVVFGELVDLRDMIDRIFGKAVHAKLHMGTQVFMPAAAVVAGVAVFGVVGDDLVADVIAERFGLRANLVDHTGQLMTKSHREHRLGAFFEFTEVAGQGVGIRAADRGVDDLDADFVLCGFRHGHFPHFDSSHRVLLKITDRRDEQLFHNGLIPFSLSIWRERFRIHAPVYRGFSLCGAVYGKSVAI